MKEIRSLMIFCNHDEKVIEKLKKMKRWSLKVADSDHGGFTFKLAKEENAFFLIEDSKRQNIVVAIDNEDSEYKNTNFALQDLSSELTNLKILNYILASKEDLF